MTGSFLITVIFIFIKLKINYIAYYIYKNRNRIIFKDIFKKTIIKLIKTNIMELNSGI